MRTLLRLVTAGMNTALLFVLPWLTGALVGMAFDVAEVTETGGRFATLFAAIVVPLLVLQLAAIAVKIGRELRAQRLDGRRGFGVFVEAVDRHVRVLTPRGFGMAMVSLLVVAIALSAKWGQFGVLAVAGLGMMYIASTLATVVSAFAVRSFDDRVRRGRGAIDREMSPTVVDAGDPVEERFVLARVPVPPFFRLHIDEALPDRLGGDTRFALDRTVSRADVTVSAPLPRTPRGVYHLGPASIWYEDVLGLTRVFVAARAKASLRALPRLRPVLFDRRPRSMTKAEGSLSVLSRLATEEHYRTRPYVNGDDLRRVHWKQSINTGQLVVRVPEAVPFAPSRVRLVLDTFLPPGLRLSKTDLEDVLDLLVEGWIGLAHALLKRGEAVTLVVALKDGDGVTVKEMECKRGEERKWRSIGADVAWQERFALHEVLAGLAPLAQPRASAILVSAGRLGVAPAPGTTFVIADGASVVLDRPADEPSRLRRVLFFDYPVGADDNRVDWRRFFRPTPPSPETLKVALAQATAAAVGQARASGAPVLLVRRRGPSLALEVP